MATYTIYAATSDSNLQSSSNTYATARGGSSLLVYPDTNQSLIVGQDFVSPTYYCYEAFLEFDTSVINDAENIEGVVLSLWGSSAAGDLFTMEARAHTWTPPLSTAQWIAGSNLAAKTRLATFPTSGFITTGYNNFTEDGVNFRTYVSKTGTTYLIVVSDTLVAGTAPVGYANVQTKSADAAGTSTDPRIVVSTSASFVATALIRKSQAGSFAANANVLGLYSFSFTAGADISKGFFRADAHIIRVTTRSLSASCFLTIPSGSSFTATPNATNGTVLVRVLRAPGSGVTTSKLYRTTTTSSLVASRPANFELTDVGAPFNSSFGYELRNYNSSGALLSTETYTGYSMSGDDWWLASTGLGTLKLTVTDHSGDVEVQTESFLPINADFKTQQVGKVLGGKGSVEIAVASADRTSLEALIESYVSSGEQVYLKTPFGEALGVVLIGYSVRLLGLGHGVIRLNYCENIK